MTEDPLSPVHPGEILLEEFLKPYGLTAGRAAARLKIARPRIEKLVRSPSTPRCAWSACSAPRPSSG
jgi:addiction module HigA family antidote